MSTHIVLLRGVNVGGKGKLPMAELRAHLSKLGFDKVQTVLQSGNAVISGGKRTGAALEKYLEAEIAKAFDAKPEIIVRAPSEWAALIKANPFKAEAKKDPSHLLAVVMKGPCDSERLAALDAAYKGPERWKADGKCLYAWFPEGIGTSALFAHRDYIKLTAQGTARNWNTVLKLAELAGA